MRRYTKLNSLNYILYFSKCFTIILLGTLITACALKDPPTSDELREQTLAHANIPAQWKQASADAVRDDWLASHPLRRLH